MRFLTLSEVLELHRQVMEQSRGLLGIRDLGAGGVDLYPSLIEKALAL